MRPHEETWSAEEVVVARDDGQWIARFSPSPGVSPDFEATRAQLAAQAPAMARLLLEAIDITADYCPWCGARLEEDEKHTDGCAAAAVLRAAGVLP